MYVGTISVVDGLIEMTKRQVCRTVEVRQDCIAHIQAAAGECHRSGTRNIVL